MEYTDDIITELGDKLKQLAPEERAYIVINFYVRAGGGSPEAKERFEKWFYKGRDFEAKMRAYERVFDEMAQEFLELTDREMDKHAERLLFGSGGPGKETLSREKEIDPEIEKVANCS